MQVLNRDSEDIWIFLINTLKWYNKKNHTFTYVSSKYEMHMNISYSSQQRRKCNNINKFIDNVYSMDVELGKALKYKT